MAHTTGEFGDFCCHTCWKEYDSRGGDVDLLIARGQRHVAPESAPTATGCNIPFSEMPPNIQFQRAGDRVGDLEYVEASGQSSGPPTHPTGGRARWRRGIFDRQDEAA